MSMPPDCQITYYSTTTEFRKQLTLSGMPTIMQKERAAASNARRASTDPIGRNQSVIKMKFAMWFYPLRGKSGGCHFYERSILSYFCR